MLRNNISKKQLAYVIGKLGITIALTSLLSLAVQANSGTWQSPGVYQFTADATGKYEVIVEGAAGGYDEAIRTATYTDNLGKVHDYAYNLGYLGHGGRIAGYYNMTEGQTVYIAVGGQGGKNSGGYNGGGAGANNSWGGGGASCVYTAKRGDGQLQNYAEYKNEIVAVAGGGGGMGTGWKNTTNATFLCGSGYSYGDQGQAITYNGEADFSDRGNLATPGSTNTQGYAFGKGQACRGIYNMGYGGGGGSGMMGGYAGVDGRGGGAAGAGYYGKLYSTFGSAIQSLEYNGKVSIKYVGAVQQTIIIDPNNGGQFNGVSQVKQYQGQANQNFWLGDPQPKSGYEFLYWIKTTNTGVQSTVAKGGRNVQYDWQTTTYKAVWKAPLTLTATNVGTGMVQLYLNEPDDFNKYYRIKKQTDNRNWSYISDTSSWIENKSGSGNISSTQQQQCVPGNWSFSVRAGCGGRTYSNQAVGAGATAGGSTVIEKTTTVYWIMGGTVYDSNSGGSNGGGSGGNWNGGGGGGASNLSINQYKPLSQTSDSNIWLAAGGGGGYGGKSNDQFWNSWCPGGGGIWSGGNPVGCQVYGYGAQQSGGGQLGGSWGQGGNGSGEGGGGGGGRYGGGGGGQQDQYKSGGGGGSGKIALSSGQASSPFYTRDVFSSSGSWSYNDKKTQYPLLTSTDFTDQAAPNIPLNKGITYNNSKIQINYLQNGDNGTLTYFKAWQYNSDDNQLLRESNTIQIYYKQGVRGYRYKIQSNSQDTATNSDNWTESTVYETTGQAETRYLHVAAVDWKGNIGPTLHIYIPNSVAINYYKNNQSATGVDGQQQLIGYAKTDKIKTTKELGIALANNRFKFWTTAQNGTGTKYLESEQVTYSTLVQRHGYQFNLYANWEPTYVLYIDPNGGSWYDGNDIKRSGGAQATSDFSLSATKKTYQSKVQFRMGHGDIKTIQDAIRLGYNFKGWSIKI